MATNIKTVITYPLNGSTTEFAVPFEYLARKFVQVTLIGQDRKVLVLNQDYRFSTKAIISTTKAWGSADGYDTIEIRRYTSATERLVDFTDGSILRAYDLNVSQLQTIHVAEEARDLTADTIGVNNDGNLDARGRRIVNVGDPVEDGDAVTLRSLKRWNDSALVSANKAKASEDNAKASETSASQSASTATQQATNAANSASQSNTARIAAEAARDRSEAARDRSESARTSSESARDASKDWAEKAVDSAVEPGMYSSKHWAVKSSQSATSAKSEADRAKTEADKLANTNALASELEGVDTTNHIIIFKGSVVTRDGLTSAKNIKGTWPTGGWSSSQLTSSIEQDGYTRARGSLYVEGSQGAGTGDTRSTWASHHYDTSGALRGSTYASLYPPQSGRAGRLWTQRLNLDGFQTGWDGPQNAYESPIWINNLPSPNNDGWVPSISFQTYSSGGYPIRATNGLIARGPTTWPDYGIRLRGDGQWSSTYFFTMGGGISAWLSNFSGQQSFIEFQKTPVSDSRLKDVQGAVDKDEVLRKVNELEFVNFTFKADEKGEVRRGVIAQQAKAVDDQYVKHHVMPERMGYDAVDVYTLDTVPMLLDAIAAIQVLTKRIEQLEGRK